VAPRDGVTLLEALREDLGEMSVKDGCAPQGQCGCCTVLVDGAARVACVTPVRRVAGRDVVTSAGLAAEVSSRLIGSFARHGASQCGFCTPGILCRLAALGAEPGRAKVETALLAHLCRCTGWRTVVDAACDQGSGSEPPASPGAGASIRASLEGRTPQRVGPEIIAGQGGFADDTAPRGCLVAVPDGAGGWAVGDTLAEARSASGKVQGRRSGRAPTYPLDVPDGDWDLRLQTTWVEPAYLEPDASWCEPGGEPVTPVANGGAFGGKTDSPAPGAAKMLAERYGRAVRVVLSREDVVRLGPKRPPVAAGVRLDGSGSIRVASAVGVAEAIRSIASAWTVEEVALQGPRASVRLRAAGWAEAAVLLEAARALREGRVPAAPLGGVGSATVVAPDGGKAEAAVAVDDAGLPVAVELSVRCGPVLDEVTMRSYATGAAHMGLGWVCSEAVAVGEDGMPDDLTIRSFGVLRARETPPIEVRIVDGAYNRMQPVNASDAAFAAVAAAVWIAQGLPSRWPTRTGRTP
jgi:xanthine dehydrogenase small subunit